MRVRGAAGPPGARRASARSASSVPALRRRAVAVRGARLDTEQRSADVEAPPPQVAQLALPNPIWNSVGRAAPYFSPFLLVHALDDVGRRPSRPLDDRR